MRGFCREPFRINIESFQALSLILSLVMTLASEQQFTDGELCGERIVALE